MSAPQMMFILTHVPGKRTGGIGMPKQFANICRSHPHFAHPGGRSSACPMRGNGPNYVGLTDSGQLTEERDRRIIEESRSHGLIAILEQVVRWLVRFAVWKRLLLGRPHTFPHLNSISNVGGDRHIELPSQFVGRHPKITELLSGFHLHPLGIAHFWCPFPSHTSDAEPSDLIPSARCCDPDQTGSPIVG